MITRGYFSLSPEDGTALYLAAKKQGIRNQTELGEKMGWSQGRVSRKLYGRTMITYEQLKRIYELAGSPAELQPIMEKYSSLQYSSMRRISTEEASPVEQSLIGLLETYFSQIRVNFKNLPRLGRIEVISSLEKLLEDLNKT